MFGLEYEKVMNSHGYDRICQYYLQPGDYDTDDEAELMQEILVAGRKITICFGATSIGLSK